MPGRDMAGRCLVQAEADTDPLPGAHEHQEEGGQRGR